MFNNKPNVTIKEILYVSTATMNVGGSLKWVDGRPTIDNVIGIQYLSSFVSDRGLIAPDAFICTRSADLTAKFNIGTYGDDVLGISPNAGVLLSFSKYPTSISPRRLSLSNIGFSLCPLNSRSPYVAASANTQVAVMLKVLVVDQQ
jgi:hypothetical protein